MWRMTAADRALTDSARDFPDHVPVLVDASSGIMLRPLAADDLPAVVELCRDAELVRWSTMALPAGGYRLADAQAFLEVVADGWRTGRRLSWAVTSEVDGVRRFAGQVHLQLDGSGVAEIGFALHPSARGRSVMSTAVRLVRDYGFDVVGLEAIRWRALVGNWTSRRVAAAAGFIHDGTVRRLLVQRGQLRDGWVGTITSDDPRVPQPWLQPTELAGRRVQLRSFRPSDAGRIVEGCSDPRTQHWLVSLPRPYTTADALRFMDAVLELGAGGGGLVWCISDLRDHRCLGSIGLEGLGGYSKRAEIGYWAHPDARGRGLVTEAVRLVTEHAESTGLTDSIIIRCARGNTASRRVAETAGYAQIGVQRAAEPLGDGTVDDLVMYARL
jgi:ribosomal-protein-alanine N-acetyltransferase